MGFYTCKLCGCPFEHHKAKNYCSKECLSVSRKSKDIDFISFNNESRDFLPYFAGLVFGDGCLTTTGKKIEKERIVLCLKDYDIMERFRVIMCPHRKLYTSTPKNQYQSIAYSLETRNENVISYFKRIGLTRRKSLDKIYPAIFDKDNPDTVHFIRGYFDANGSAFQNNVSGYSYIHISISCGSYSFLKRLKDVLEDFGIKSSIVCDSRGSKTQYLKMYSMETVSKFKTLIYPNNNFEWFLQRKKDKFNIVKK
ncbi:MAG: LAGLIDADG family homing endonuclease [Paraclostridium sp.]